LINNDAKIINGIKHSKNLTDKIKELVLKSEKLNNRKPSIAVILIGENSASEIYVKNKIKIAENIGIISKKIVYPSLISEEELFEIEQKIKNKEDAISQVKFLKKKVKETISSKEISLDDITLNTSNSNKVQISVPSNLTYLMKVWAAAEGRDLSSVAFQCLETGIREMKSKGSIPSVAVNRYDSACQKRIALAEVNNLLEKYELAQDEIK